MSAAAAAATAASSLAQKQCGPHQVLTRPALLSHIFKFVAREHKDVKLLHVNSAWEDTAINHCPWMWQRVARAHGVEDAPPSFHFYVTRVWVHRSYCPALLSRLRDAEVVDLSDCFRLNETGVEQIGRLSALRELDLSGTPGLSHLGLEHLSRLPLRSLDISNTRISGLKHVGMLVSLERLAVAGCSINDAELQHLGGLQQLQSLSLQSCDNITDDGVKALKQLAELNVSKCVRLSDATFSHLACTGPMPLQRLKAGGLLLLTDAGLKSIGRLTTLTELDVSDCTSITHAGVAHLTNLQQLQSLDLGGCYKLADAAATHLASLRQLQNLGLQGCWQMTDVGLADIAKLSLLRTLNLRECYKLSNFEQLGRQLTALRCLDVSECRQLTDSGVEQLAQLRTLESLNLSLCSRLTNVALQHVSAGLPSLKSLKIIDLNITDAGFDCVGKLALLERLDFCGCSEITQAAVAKFVAAHPRCVVEH